MHRARPSSRGWRREVKLVAGVEDSHGGGRRTWSIAVAQTVLVGDEDGGKGAMANGAREWAREQEGVGWKSLTAAYLAAMVA